MLDTDVVIGIDRGEIQLPDALCSISVLTLYEFIRGKTRHEEAKRLSEIVYRILPLDNEVLLKATGIWKMLRDEGELIDERDLLVGATAIANNIPLYTLNRKHYDRLIKFGLKYWNPVSKDASNR